MSPLHPLHTEGMYGMYRGVSEAIFGKTFTFGNVKTVFDLSNILKENVKKKKHN